MVNEKIHIKWIDSKGITPDWEHVEDIEPLLPVTCETIGFLVESNKEYITVAQSITEGQVMGRMTIPMCCVLKKTKI
jgi:hypothetical protein